MDNRTVRLLLLLAAASLLLPADQIVLTNGDVLTGSIVKLDGGKLAVKTEALGQITVSWAAVKSVKSDETLTVVLAGGETAFGTIALEDGTLRISGEGAPRSVAAKDIIAMRDAAEQRAWQRLERPGVFQLWNGFFDLGLALVRGNARTNTLTMSFNSSRISRNDKTAAYLNQIRGSARVKGQTSTIADAVRGGWSYSRNLVPRLFVSGFNDYEYDRFQNLDLRFVAGSAFGYSAANSDKLRLDLIGGLNYARENFDTGLRRNSGEANFGDELRYKPSGATTLMQSFRLFPNFTRTGEYRLNFDLSAVTALSRWLAWQVTASDRFLSNPLTGRQRNDVLLSTGLRLSFVR